MKTTLYTTYPERFGVVRSRVDTIPLVIEHANGRVDIEATTDSRRIARLELTLDEAESLRDRLRQILNHSGRP